MYLSLLCVTLLRSLLFQVNRLGTGGSTASGGGTYRISKLQAEVTSLQADLQQSQRACRELLAREKQLEEMIFQLRAGRVSSFLLFHVLSLLVSSV